MLLYHKGKETFYSQAFTPSAPETIGGLIGISLITFLPAFFLLRNKKDENENDEKNQ